MSGHRSDTEYSMNRKTSKWPFLFGNQMQKPKKRESEKKRKRTHTIQNLIKSAPKYINTINNNNNHKNTQQKHVYLFCFIQNECVCQQLFIPSFPFKMGKKMYNPEMRICSHIRKCERTHRIVALPMDVANAEMNIHDGNRSKSLLLLSIEMK